MCRRQATGPTFRIVVSLEQVRRRARGCGQPLRATRLGWALTFGGSDTRDLAGACPARPTKGEGQARKAGAEPVVVDAHVDRSECVGQQAGERVVLGAQLAQRSALAGACPARPTKGVGQARKAGAEPVDVDAMLIVLSVLGSGLVNESSSAHSSVIRSAKRPFERSATCASWPRAERPSVLGLRVRRPRPRSEPATSLAAAAGGALSSSGT
eukprot:CAMPEP_0180015494 /NCGR_PEP_ID=MMETSP0984-20121128/18774_1 /TAXON_ID=483367 /ORGANISM="non described non described, Strain CCMP 2436" /LENGTH=211 /DNA_ID=CAMNT_0021938307 /DNA_START=260 /DNA_END=893 /DNA_ORIENTATION=-